MKSFRPLVRRKIVIGCFLFWTRARLLVHVLRHTRISEPRLNSLCTQERPRQVGQFFRYPQRLFRALSNSFPVSPCGALLRWFDKLLNVFVRNTVLQNNLFLEVRARTSTWHLLLHLDLLQDVHEREKVTFVARAKEKRKCGIV